MPILAGTHPGLKQDACRLPAHALWFRRRLLAWYARHGRRLPWRGVADPYAVLVSEIMLQQTQVARVTEFFPRFLARYPTLEELAAAPSDAVREAWDGLGYYARARNLHAAARHVVDRLRGVLPERPGDLRRLPGIGRYTAGAPAPGLTRPQSTPVLQRYSAARTAPLAAPIRVLCDSATYLRPRSTAGSARRRPTLVAIPPSASRSRRGWGRKGSSCTMMAWAGALGRSRPA